MGYYILRRLLLLPLTIFCIVLVNFIIINLAPGDPVTVTEISPEGMASRKEGNSVAFGSDDRYLQFREFYGLTLPILFNSWPWIKKDEVENNLWKIVYKTESPKNKEKMEFKRWDELRIQLGDQARFIMPILLEIILESGVTEIQEKASLFFIRGGTKQAILGPNLSKEEKLYNKKISYENNYLKTLALNPKETIEENNDKKIKLKNWYKANKSYYNFDPNLSDKIKIFFFETRFFRYLKRVISLDFGTMRNDSNKTVISEVTKRFKYSLTLSFLPMVLTFFLCLIVGSIMALRQNYFIDHFLNVTFLILYAIPIFVVAPFLIEKVAIDGYFPLTNIPIPLGGFTSPEEEYDKMDSLHRFFDILQHLFLPIVAILYGGLAMQARLSRTAILEVMHQDYVRTAKVKGVAPFTILYKHIGRNAAITIITSISSSLGIILGGSLIVETLFEIDGFGKFFYDAIINRDYNVIMFSALGSSFLTLVGYLLADISYTLLDPRITLE